MGNSLWLSDCNLVYHVLNIHILIILGNTIYYNPNIHSKYPRLLEYIYIYGYMDSMVSWSRLSIDTDYTREGSLGRGEGIWQESRAVSIHRGYQCLVL